MQNKFASAYLARKRAKTSNVPKMSDGGLVPKSTDIDDAAKESFEDYMDAKDAAVGIETDVEKIMRKRRKPALK